MKRKLLLLTLLTTIATFGYSQLVEMIYKGKTLENNSTVTITDFESDEEIGVEMTFEAVIKNKTNSDISIIVYKEEISIPEGTTNSFCTSSGCYTSTKSSKYTIKANGEDKQFHSIFSPLASSKAIIKYTVEVQNSFDKNYSVIVNYNYSQSAVNELKLSDIKIGQNGDFINISYQNSSNITLRIIDLIGSVKSIYNLPATLRTFSEAISLPNGVYIFEFSDNKGKKNIQKVFIK